MKKRITLLSISSMLLLLNACSDVSSPVPAMGTGDEVAVHFCASMQPAVEVTRAKVTGTDLTPLKGKGAGIYGIRLTTEEAAAGYEWEKAALPTFHRQMKNKQYIFEEGNTLSPAGGRLDYHPSRSDSALTVYAYWPYSEEVDNEGYAAVDLTKQYDLLYSGKIISQANADKKFDPINLKFKHALGAVAFKFWSENSELQGKQLTRIAIHTDYNLQQIRMRIADATFSTTTATPGIYEIDLTEGGTKEATIASANNGEIQPVGEVMLLPGEGISRIVLYWEGNDDPETGCRLYTRGAGQTLTLKAGVCQTLTFKCIDNGFAGEDGEIEEGEMIVNPEPNELEQNTGEGAVIEEGEMFITPLPNEMEQNASEGAVIEEGEM